MTALRCAIVILVAACDTDLVITTDGNTVASNVVALRVLCDGACAPVADGTTSVTMQVCTSSDNRPNKLDATLRIPAGHWEGDAMPSTQTTVSLATTPCATRSFVPPLTPGRLDVEADVSGVRITTPVTLAAGVPKTIRVTAAPAFIAPDTVTIAISAKVATEGGGIASTGTLVNAAVSVEPVTTSAAILPAEQLVDATASVTATVVLGPGARRAVVQLTATAPSSDKPVSAPALVLLAVP